MEEAKEIVALETENLAKYFKTKTGIYKAVDGLSFKIKAGRICGFIGPNGAGKTTTIKMILGLIKPTRGTIKIFDKNIKGIEVKKFVGYMPEKPVLYEDMLPIDFLVYLGELSGMDTFVAKQRAMQLISLFNLESAIDKKIGKYSSGMKQKILLAQALLHNPKLLVLDEPTTNMDPPGQAQFFEIVKNLAKNHGVTFFISSHHLEELEKVVDEIIVINKGKLLLQSTVQEIRSRQPSEQLELEVSNLARVAQIVKQKFPQLYVGISENKLLISGPVSELRKEIIKLIVESGEEVYSAITKKKSLWDLTLELLEK